MDKKQAAKFLGKRLRSDKKPLSERSVERYIKRFNIPVREKTKTGEDGRRHTVIDIDAADVKLIAEKAAEPTEALTVVNPAAQALAQLVQRLAPPVSARIAVPVESKLTLSLAEAAALSGYSKEYLRELIKKGKLKSALGRTRGHNIKRADLDACIDSL